MPGQRSLSDSQYYAHPQNSFWWIMSRLLGISEELSYEQRCKGLIAANYALWDVLYDCRRPGSLDSNIDRSTEQPNNFLDFFETYHCISLIAFNGGAAMKIFMRHCGDVLLSYPQVSCVQLPSTSAAHASMTRHQKLALWQKNLSI